MKYRDDLPPVCATRLPTTNDPVFIKQGVRGFWPAPGINPEQFNRTLGITNAQLKAMEIGSMFGFDVPGTDPKVHEHLNCKEGHK